MTNPPPPPAPPSRYLSWPPPGLEPLHGKVWPLIATLAIGDVILVLPFLGALGTEPAFASMGPFGRQWWLLLVTTVLGIVILIGVVERAVRLAWQGGRAARDGHGWRVIVHVAIDESRDTGFLLQGVRQFEKLDARQRRLLLSLRLLAAVLSGLGGLVAPVGLMVGALAGGLGWTGTRAVWSFAWWIPLVLLLGGGLTRLAEYVLRRSARADTATRAAQTEALRGEIADWSARSAALAAHDGPSLGAAGRSGAFRATAVAIGVVFTIVTLTAIALAIGGSIGPVLTSIAVPKFSNTQGRVLEAEVYRPWMLAPDSNVTAVRAGEALHTLFFVGSSDSAAPLMREPVQRYTTPFSPLGVDTLADGIALSSAWLREEFSKGGRDLTGVQRRALRAAVQHPALTEMSTVAVAPSVEIIGTRYVLPFPQGASPIALPLPRFAPLREGARARLALALADLADGRPDRAERGVREVISVGLHLVDEGPTLIDALIGTVIAREAGDDLDGLLRATGRTREADDLLRMRTQTRHVTQRMAAVTVGGGTEEALAEMPRLVTDTAGILGLRWEFYLQITSFAPCMNLHSMVFGPGEEYRTWVDQAKRSLVHRESDAQFFEFLGRGLFGTGGCIPVVEGLALARNMQ